MLRGLVAVALVVGSFVVGSLTDAPDADAAAAARACNGSVRLCSRTFDKVALAGAHNAMANGAGFVDVAQGRSIREQLDAGIRALLLDVYQGTPNGAQVCTDPTPLKVEQLTRQLGKQAVDALIAVRNSSCPPADGPTSDVYLCHSFCETGATRLTDELAQIRSFLDEHPREVMALILEDYVDAAAIEEAFEAAGLADVALAHEPGAPWPTLKKMIRSGKRLVVFSERQGGTPDWLLPAFDEMQDTPFNFATVDEFSCVANRGPKEAKLLLVNHWVSPPEAAATAATAATANGREQLLARVEQCRTERGRGPSILAVDFAETGDLVAVVNELNGAAR